MEQNNNHIFYHHPQFIEELDVFIARHCNGTANTQESIENVQRLLNVHFFKFPQFTSKHLGPAQGFGA